jgi:transposase
VYQLKPKELAEIEKAIKQDKRPEVRQRATVIRMQHQNYQAETIAKQQMVSLATIYNWHKVWREKGIDGLANLPRKGRPAKADDAIARSWKKCLRKNHLSKGIVLRSGHRIVCGSILKKKPACC